MPTNTLLSMSMMLAKAMALVEKAKPGVCDITADFVFPSMDLTLTIDDFADAHLHPALAAALADKQPKGAIAPFAEARPGQDMEVTLGWEERGIFGRMRRSYNINKDEISGRAEILVRGVSDASS